MMHRVAPRAEADLDPIGLYVAKESGSIEIAKRLIVKGKIFAMISSKGEFVVKLPKARVDELVDRAQGRRFDTGWALSVASRGGRGGLRASARRPR